MNDTKKVKVCFVLYWIKTKGEKWLPTLKKHYCSIKIIAGTSHFKHKYRSRKIIIQHLHQCQLVWKKYNILIFYNTALIPCQSIGIVELQNKNKIVYFDGYIMYLYKRRFTQHKDSVWKTTSRKYLDWLN